MMYINREDFEAWMERMMERFDKLDKILSAMNEKRSVLDGVRLLDNQDLCQLLRVSKRTLQRYRDLGELPFQTIYHKTYYKETDVHIFIREHFNKKRGKDGDLETEETEK